MVNRDDVVKDYIRQLDANNLWISNQIQEVKNHRWRFSRNAWVLMAVSMRLHEQQKIIGELNRLAHGAEPRWYPVVDPRLISGMPPDLDRRHDL